jgi:hypothetical protein
MSVTATRYVLIPCARQAVPRPKVAGARNPIPGSSPRRRDGRARGCVEMSVSVSARSIDRALSRLMAD